MVIYLKLDHIRDETVKIFGRRVRAKRLALKLSQTQLAEKSRSGVSHISGIERGLSNPTLETMIRISEALGCHVADMLTAEA